MGSMLLSESLVSWAQASRAAARQLALLSAETRQQALDLIAQDLEAAQEQILAANRRDLVRAEQMVAEGSLSGSAYGRLKLTESKLAVMIAGVRDVQKLPELLGQPQFVRELDQGLILERRTCPLGVLGIIFESRPDAVSQIVSLAIKTGNSVLLKGGSEALDSCQTLVQVIRQALARIPGFPVDCVQLLTSREEIRALLELDHLVDLIIPRGSNGFVRYVQSHTRIPVLGHADGLCHLYVDRAADLEMAVRLTVDAKVQYPAACNAIETLLVHEQIAPTFLPLVAAALGDQGVRLRGCPITQQSIPSIRVDPASDEDWATEYGDLILAIRVVPDLEAALAHIQTYGSRHTEAIVTEDPQRAEQFLSSVDAAGVFHNASTRFADGYRYGFGAEVGISTQKMPPRGPVGIEGLVTYTYRLRGSGQIVADYSGDQARPFTHRDLGD